MRGVHSKCIKSALFSSIGPGSTRLASRQLSHPKTFATLIVAQHTHAKLSPTTYCAVTATRSFDDDITVLVAGDGCEGAAKEAAACEGVTKVLHVEGGAPLKKPVADTLANLLFAIQKEKSFNTILGPVSAQTRDTLPRLAALLDVPPISDISGIEDGGTVFVRPTYAGNAIAHIKPKDETKVKVITIRPTCFAPTAEASSPCDIEVFDKAVVEALPTPLTEVVKEELDVSDTPKLQTAKVVVSGGRGLGSKEAFDDVIAPLCKKLKAAMGASRAAVDAGYVPNDMQVGQTGKVVAPELYIAIGISGAIQHLAGMKDAKTIVAINKDAEAPIFTIADAGLVGDLFKLVPELTEKMP